MKEGRTTFSIEHDELPPRVQQDEKPEDANTNGTEKPTSDVDRDSSEKIAGTAPVEGDTYVPKPVPRDPIRWFGLLIPQDLRKSQNFFVAAVDEVVGPLTTAESELNRVAIEVRRTRKQMARLE